MAKKLSVALDAPIQWPKCCARCGADTDLTVAGVSIGSMSGIAPRLDGLAITSTMVSLKYPVCRAHAGGLGLAGFVTRRTAGLSFLRGFSYFVGVLGVAIFAVMAARAVGLAPRNNLPTPWPFLAIFAGGIAASAYFIHAMRTLPVRLVGQSRETVTIRFANDAFAADFYARNRRNLRDVPWWKKFIF